MIILSGCNSYENPIGSPSEVRDDVTGNFKKTVANENVDIIQNIKSYSDEFMEPGETHFIIDFYKNNTFVINNFNSDTLYIQVLERVDREEHSAKTIGGGMLLNQYMIDSTGNITELKDDM